MIAVKNREEKQHGRAREVERDHCPSGMMLKGADI